MTTDQSESTTTSRRRFFKAAICAPALAVAGSAAGATAPAPAVPAPDDGKASSYHETPHIRTYYNLSHY
jgi:hypothetical protein